MQLMQRLGSEVTEEYIDQFVEAASQYPGSCDNVWFATMYGFPSLQTHRKMAEFLGKAAKKFRDKGISVSLQFSNTIGHGEYMSSRDCSGLVYEGSPVRKMVGHDGTVADYAFCWRGSHFREYLIRQITDYASQIQPERIWVDDDFRAAHHSPVRFGCFCEECIRDFNALYGSEFDRDGLVAALLSRDTIWRQRYIAFMRQGMSDLMYAIGSAIHGVAPDTAMGLQHGSYGTYTGFGFDFLFQAMRDATGHQPASRPGGGAYNDHDPNHFLFKGMEISWQNACLPEYVERRAPEIENLPFCVFGKSPAGTALETSYYLACGATDMSYSMIMDRTEPMGWHGQEFSLFSQHRAYWEKLSGVNRESCQTGLRYFVSEEGWKKTLPSGAGFEEMTADESMHAGLWIRDGIPVAFDRVDGNVILLHPACARNLTDQDIAWLLTQNVLTDGETIDVLRQRGVELGLEAHKLSLVQDRRLKLQMTADPVNGALTEWTESFFTAGKNENYYLEPRGCPCRILSFYTKVLPLEPLTKDADYPYGLSDVLIRTPQGGNWAIFGHTIWKGIMNFGRREQLLNAADAIGSRKLAARVLTPFQLSLLPRMDADGKTVCVSVTNCTVGESGELELVIRNPRGEKFSFLSQYDGGGDLPFEKRGEDYHLRIPGIKPWSVLTVFMEA